MCELIHLGLQPYPIRRWLDPLAPTRTRPLGQEPKRVRSKSPVPEVQTSSQQSFCPRDMAAWVRLCGFNHHHHQKTGLLRVLSSCWFSALYTGTGVLLGIEAGSRSWSDWVDGLVVSLGGLSFGPSFQFKKNRSVFQLIEFKYTLVTLVVS